MNGKGRRVINARGTAVVYKRICRFRETTQNSNAGSADCRSPSSKLDYLSLSDDGNRDLKERISTSPRKEPKSESSDDKGRVIFYWSVMAAAFSGVVGAVIASPFYLVKTQLHVV